MCALAQTKKERSGQCPSWRRRSKPLLQSLKRVREERGVSVRQLSAKSGVSADSISDFEELHRMASPRTTRKLAEALGVSEKELR